MNDVGLVQTILDLTSLSFLDSLSHIHGNSTSLGVRHQATGTEDLTEAAHNAHHVGGSDHHVEIHPAALDLLDHFFCTDKVSTGSLSCVGLLALADSQHADRFAGAVGQDDSATNLLVSVTAVNAQLYVHFYGLVKLGGTGLDAQVQCFVCIIKLAAVDQLEAVDIFLTVFHWFVLPVEW